MAIKKSFSKTDQKHRTCLSCNHKIEERLKDNTIHKCVRCGQKHFVDVYSDVIVLTVAERPEIRRRHTGSATDTAETIRELRRELSEALAEAQEWKEAAEGLARMVEEMKANQNQKEGFFSAVRKEAEKLGNKEERKQELNK